MKYLSLIALTVPLFFGGCLLDKDEPSSATVSSSTINGTTSSAASGTPSSSSQTGNSSHTGNNSSGTNLSSSDMNVTSSGDIIVDVDTGIDGTLTCGDVPADKQSAADALVEKANNKAIREMEDMFNADSWDEATINAPTGALSLYNQALEIAPSHCGALFGKSLASMMVLTQDDDLNDFIDKMEATPVIERGNTQLPTITDEVQINSIGNPAFNITPEQSPTFLLKASAQLSEADPVTVQELQNVIAQSILPEVNASISRLSAILEAGNFEFNFTIRPDTRDEKTFQIDNGEIGPMLAGMRIFKSYLIVVLAHNLDFSDNGSYEWINTISDLEDEDYANLNNEERAALDHLTGLFSKSSSFTAIKPDYAQAFAAIPDELLQALRDVKTGLEYGIKEAQSSTNTQENDIYVVGTGIDADVDPQDLQTAVDQMKHFEKYFLGTVPITYARGTKTLEVNFPALFTRTSNIQSFLPYYELNPYEEWNDVVGSDTMWTTIELDNYTWDQDEPCTIEEDDGRYKVMCTRDGNERSYSSYEFCRASSIQNEWKCLYDSRWDIDELTKGPFYFTDVAGNKTYGPGDDEPDDITDLTGKIVFPDPTFGGIFPNLTNDNIFEYIESLEDISPYDAQDCEDIEVRDEVYGGSYYRWECHTNPLPANPSDLDRLLFMFASFDD
ncbi:MAG: hypothetical protein OCC49_11540 [Fibrobacterales bacterium]